MHNKAAGAGYKGAACNVAFQSRAKRCHFMAPNDGGVQLNESPLKEQTFSKDETLV